MEWKMYALFQQDNPDGINVNGESFLPVWWMQQCFRKINNNDSDSGKSIHGNGLGQKL